MPYIMDPESAQMKFMTCLNLYGQHQYSQKLGHNLLSLKKMKEPVIIEFCVKQISQQILK